jgi:hypothetical protein
LAISCYALGIEQKTQLNPDSQNSKTAALFAKPWSKVVFPVPAKALTTMRGWLHSITSDCSGVGVIIFTLNKSILSRRFKDARKEQGFKFTALLDGRI